jgi:hypothetical protein
LGAGADLDLLDFFGMFKPNKRTNEKTIINQPNNMKNEKQPAVYYTNPPKLALTRVEAGEALGVTTVTVDRLAKRGLLRPSRATRRSLYPIWELERFLRETVGRIEP